MDIHLSSSPISCEEYFILSLEIYSPFTFRYDISGILEEHSSELIQEDKIQIDLPFSESDIVSQKWPY